METLSNFSSVRFYPTHSVAGISVSKDLLSLWDNPFTNTILRLMSSESSNNATTKELADNSSLKAALYPSKSATTDSVQHNYFRVFITKSWSSGLYMYRVLLAQYSAKNWK